MTSPRLCGGMDVAIPTAIPLEPFTRRFGISGRKNYRLLFVTVEIRLKIDGIFIHISEHLQRERSHSRFCITHCSSAVPVDRTEVSVSVHQQDIGCSKSCASLTIAS